MCLNLGVKMGALNLVRSELMKNYEEVAFTTSTAFLQLLLEHHNHSFIASTMHTNHAITPSHLIISIDANEKLDCDLKKKDSNNNHIRVHKSKILVRKNCKTCGPSDDILLRYIISH